MIKRSHVMIRKKYVLTVSRLSEEKETVATEEPTIKVSKEIVSVPRPSRKNLYAGIIVALIIGLAIGYATSSYGYRNQQQQYENLVKEYNELQEEYDRLYTSYESLLDVMKEPRTTIVGGNVTWRFTTLDEALEEWYMPLETYVNYVNKLKPEEYHYLSTDGQSFQVRNMELFVEPEFFSEVISSLTDGNSAGAFVQEVFNLRVQLTVYSEEITETPQWSGETMTLGTGDCEDFAILMGSLLMAGNEHADYSMTVKMVYMDTNNPTDPQTVNHALIHIIYENGTGEFVDSTSTDVQSPWSEVVGWYFDL